MAKRSIYMGVIVGVLLALAGCSKSSSEAGGPAPVAGGPQGSPAAPITSSAPNSNSKAMGDSAVAAGAGGKDKADAPK